MYTRTELRKEGGFGWFVYNCQARFGYDVLESCEAA